jgi:hypothetical protein
VRDRVAAPTDPGTSGSVNDPFAAPRVAIHHLRAIYQQQRLHPLKSSTWRHVAAAVPDASLIRQVPCNALRKRSFRAAAKGGGRCGRCFRLSATARRHSAPTDAAISRTVRARAHVDTNLFFQLFGGGPTRRVSETSAALYSDKAIEVAMMLDVTGSMSGQKIKDLKTAANNALDAFLANQDPKNPRVRVAIVPYADAVNTGALSNTVYAETKFTTSEPPALDDPRGVSTAPDECATERKGREQFTDASPYTTMVNRDYRLKFCPAATLTPLSADIAALKKTVGKFSASGSTAGHIGIQWSWYMLSPKWANVLPKASDPAAYDPKKVAKYAILMTDGEFNTAFAGVPKKDETTGAQATRSRNYAEELCDKMKADGIEVFTVGFMLKEAGAKAVLGDCASPDSASTTHYFETSSGEQLNAAFLEIVRNIERLAVTE